MYRVLALDSNAKTMSLPVLRKIAQLAKGGAVITGVKPVGNPSLSGDIQEFNRLVGEVWNAGNRQVITGKPLSEVLPALNIQPDFMYTKPRENTRLMYVHRKLANSDIYWVNSRNDSAQTVEATFRVAGKKPQLWHPETGKTEEVSYSISDGITKVRLPLSPNDAVFVMFADNAAKAAISLPATKEKVVAAADGSWNVAFQPNRGAPGSATFNELKSYTENDNAGIRYFSGTATYTKTITVPSGTLVKGAKTWLDLGDVQNLAEVTVNGKWLGVVWTQPYRVDVTREIKSGSNKIEIKVVNLWVNRLIGDAQRGVTNKITYTAMPFYNADAKLLPSGLLGPVKVVAIVKQ